MPEYPYIQGRQILIVDDEPDVLDVLEELLAMGQVTRAPNFTDAKKLLETQVFEIVILDIMGVKGYDLLEIANARKITAVMLTAHALSPDNLVKSYKEGAASYLPKEEMVNIASFLNDIMEAKEKGDNPWVRWYDRLGSYFEKRFGKDWQKADPEFEDKFPFY